VHGLGLYPQHDCTCPSVPQSAVPCKRPSAHEPHFNRSYPCQKLTARFLSACPTQIVLCPVVRAPLQTPECARSSQHPPLGQPCSCSLQSQWWPLWWSWRRRPARALAPRLHQCIGWHGPCGVGGALLEQERYGHRLSGRHRQPGAWVC
jgi:hypothetical protein